MLKRRKLKLALPVIVRSALAIGSGSELGDSIAPIVEFVKST